MGTRGVKWGKEGTNHGPVSIGSGVYKHRKVLQSVNNYGKVCVFDPRCTSRVPPFRGVMKV